MRDTIPVLVVSVGVSWLHKAWCLRLSKLRIGSWSLKLKSWHLDMVGWNRIVLHVSPTKKFKDFFFLLA